MRPSQTKAIYIFLLLSGNESIVMNSFNPNKEIDRTMNLDRGKEMNLRWRIFYPKMREELMRKLGIG